MLWLNVWKSQLISISERSLNKLSGRAKEDRHRLLKEINWYKKKKDEVKKALLEKWYP